MPRFPGFRFTSSSCSFSLAFAWVLYRERTTEVQAKDSVILGKEELIELSTREGGETREVLAKIDLGTGYSSID
jgi:hypothetical protein